METLQRAWGLCGLPEMSSGGTKAGGDAGNFAVTATRSRGFSSRGAGGHATSLTTRFFLLRLALVGYRPGMLQAYRRPVVFLGLLFLGCSGQDNAAVVAQCETLARAWCERLVGCLIELEDLAEDERDSSEELCQDGYTQAARCDSATSVTDQYDECVEDIDALPCSRFQDREEDEGRVSALPRSCVGAVHVN